MLIALLLFAATYVLMLLLPKRRPIVALASAAIFVISGMLSPGRAQRTWISPPVTQEKSKACMGWPYSIMT